MASEIERAYKYCESVTRLHAKSFYFAAKFLPARKRRPIYALYALCRQVDDEVDESGARNESEAIAAVENWRAKLDAVYFTVEKQGRGGAGNGRSNAIDNRRLLADAADADERQNLVLFAWRDLLQTYKIPPNLPLELMKGVLMDTHVKRYETFEELYVYCWRVASTVGLMTSEIFGYEKKETLDYAEALGIAMQLTNILRDIREDAAMNRIYLPQEDLRKFGVREKQIFDAPAAAAPPDENFVELMKFQIERARRFYRKAEKGIPLLERDARFAVLLASRFYARILDEIERQNYDVFKRRARTNLQQKILAVPRIWRAARKMKPQAGAD